MRPTDGKLKSEGRVRRRSRTCACCLHDPEPRFPAASSGSRSSLFSGLFLTIEFPKGIAANAAANRPLAAELAEFAEPERDSGATSPPEPRPRAP